MRRSYTIKELESIFGCSRTAIVKKIKPTPDNPSVKRYKERFDVVIENGQMCIIFDEYEIEQEKRLSKGMGKITQNSYNTQENEDIIDIEPIVNESKKNELYEFTERYMQQFVTFQETTTETIRNLEREKMTYENQLKLIEDHNNIESAEKKKIINENVMLKKHNTVLIVITLLLVMVLVGFITHYVTFINVSQNVIETSQPQIENLDIKKEPSQQINVKKAQR